MEGPEPEDARGPEEQGKAAAPSPQGGPRRERGVWAAWAEGGTGRGGGAGAGPGPPGVRRQRRHKRPGRAAPAMAGRGRTSRAPASRLPGERSTRPPRPYLAFLVAGETPGPAGRGARGGHPGAGPGGRTAPGDAEPGPHGGRCAPPAGQSAEPRFLPLCGRARRPSGGPGGQRGDGRGRRMGRREHRPPARRVRPAPPRADPRAPCPPGPASPWGAPQSRWQERGPLPALTSSFPATSGAGGGRPTAGLSSGRTATAGAARGGRRAQGAVLREPEGAGSGKPRGPCGSRGAPTCPAARGRTRSPRGGHQDGAWCWGPQGRVSGCQSLSTLIPRRWERALWPPSELERHESRTWNGHSSVPMGRGEPAIASPPPLRQLLNLFHRRRGTRAGL